MKKIIIISVYIVLTHNTIFAQALDQQHVPSLKDLAFHAVAQSQKNICAPTFDNKPLFKVENLLETLECNKDRYTAFMYVFNDISSQLSSPNSFNQLKFYICMNILKKNDPSLLEFFLRTTNLPNTLFAYEHASLIKKPSNYLPIPYKSSETTIYQTHPLLITSSYVWLKKCFPHVTFTPKDQLSLVDILLNYKADPDLNCYENEYVVYSALDYAQNDKHYALVLKLLKADAALSSIFVQTLIEDFDKWICEELDYEDLYKILLLLLQNYTLNVDEEGEIASFLMNHKDMLHKDNFFVPLLESFFNHCCSFEREWNTATIELVAQYCDFFNKPLDCFWRISIIGLNNNDKTCITTYTLKILNHLLCTYPYYCKYFSITIFERFFDTINILRNDSALPQEIELCYKIYRCLLRQITILDVYKKILRHITQDISLITQQSQDAAFIFAEGILNNIDIEKFCELKKPFMALFNTIQNLLATSPNYRNSSLLHAYLRIIGTLIFGRCRSSFPLPGSFINFFLHHYHLLPDYALQQILSDVAVHNYIQFQNNSANFPFLLGMWLFILDNCIQLLTETSHLACWQWLQSTSFKNTNLGMLCMRSLTEDIIASAYPLTQPMLNIITESIHTWRNTTKCEEQTVYISLWKTISSYLHRIKDIRERFKHIDTILATYNLDCHVCAGEYQRGLLYFLRKLHQWLSSTHDIEDFISARDFALKIAQNYIQQKETLKKCIQTLIKQHKKSTSHDQITIIPYVLKPIINNMNQLLEIINPNETEITQYERTTFNNLERSLTPRAIIPTCFTMLAQQTLAYWKKRATHCISSFSLKKSLGIALALCLGAAALKKTEGLYRNYSNQEPSIISRL